MYDKIFIVGGIGLESSVLWFCELYKILLNEWEVIVSLNVFWMLGSMVCLFVKLYVLGGLGEFCIFESDKFIVELYDEVNDEWKKIIMMIFEKISEGLIFILVSVCLVLFFNLGVNNFNYDLLIVEFFYVVKINFSILCICCVM